ncbi:hypothetical protein J8F10_17795 [Gemmata sp. G18]|uniref:Exo-alpha-sialidase n=1 Tax=Gemmata palustris TaxID=2822762 RepID=A0ABS5BTT1_9BACT|nr:hypothetical protein [Gemmata palustris]MBP3957121.1 hypothetical protein [Gemmata palustris]
MRFVLLSLAVFIGPAARAADGWQPVATELLAKEKTGFGGLSGVAVDHDTGTLFVCLSDRGVFRSADSGKTWERHGKDVPKGRTETPGCLQRDPTGKTKTLLMATVYGGPVIVASSDPATPWRTMDKKCEHVDWCAVDWTDPEMKFALAFKHEAGGLLLLSRDGGKSFSEAGKGHGLGAWVFDADTAVVAREKSRQKATGGILRTTDGGKTFKPVADYTPVALPKPQGDALFWLVEGALLKGTEKGAKWEKVSDVKDARYGPVFGKDAMHLFVLTASGVIESTDSGATWAKPIAVPKELKGVSALTWLEYDPKNDLLYVMKMGSDLYKLARPK